MKVIIRTLQQKTFEIDAEPHQTVLYLKERFGAIQGESLEYIKLFYSGRNLIDNEKSIESLNVKEGGYFVAMVVKPRTEFEEADDDTSTPPSSVLPMPTFSRSEFTAPTSIPIPSIKPVPSTSFSASSSDPVPKPSSTSSSSIFNNDKWTSMSGGSMSGASMLGASMLGASMSGSSNSGASMLEAMLGSSMLGASPFGASMSGALKSGVSSSGASMSGASMSGASMSGASKSGASSSGASPFGVSEDSVKNLVDMGFKRDQVMKALKASFGSTERAVEYLTGGIPENLLDEDSSPFPSRPFSSKPFSLNSSAFRPFGTPSLPSFPRPTEMVGHIEEVDPNEPEEEPSKSDKPESAPASPMKEVIESDPTSSATEPTPSSAPQPTVANETPSAPSPVDPTPPSPTISSSSTPLADPEPSSSSSVIPRPTPTPSTSNSTSTPSLPSGFSGLSAFGGFGGSSGGENVTLESLRDDPMIQNIRELAGQNPDLIGPLLEQLVQSKPRVMGLMGSNPEGLARLFTSGGGSSSRTEGKSHTICVSGEEKEALDRLENMGFPRAMVIQAYFAFDKNEEQAANYLVENCEDN